MKNNSLEKNQQQKPEYQCPEIMNTLNAGIISVQINENLTFLWGNRTFFESIGYTEEEFFESFQNLAQFYEDDIDCYKEIRTAADEALERKDEKIQLKVRIPSKTGELRMANFGGTILYEENGSFPVLQAVLQDITEIEKEKEEALKLYEDKDKHARWMMKEYRGNIYISDLETYDLLYMNQPALEAVRRRPDEISGKKCYEIVQGRTSPCPFCNNNQLSEEKVYEWEHFNSVLDQTFIIKNKIINWEGHKARIELSHDTFSTEYKLMKKDKERNAMMKSIPGGFARIDARDFRTVLWYGGDYLDLIEYTAEQFERELNSQCNYIHPDDLEYMTSAMDKMIVSGERVVISECRVITRSGKVKILTITLAYAKAEDCWDGIPSFYSIGLDVTKEREEQERQRKALEDAYEVARVSNDAKTNFLSSMSHDIRTPMNAIMGMSLIAQANIDSQERVQDCLSKINVSSQHLLNLINEVLDMSKIESGKIDLVSEVVSLPDLFQNIIDMCRSLMSEKKQELQISASLLRCEKVISDEGRLQQVLMNLLSNAIKYTPEGGIIKLLIRELPSIVPHQGQYEFVFQDNGIGMPAEFIPHIFEPFSRAEDNRISKIQGTGLGMAITENIIHMMNGTIQVKSRLGEGSQFTVSLPLEQCREEEDFDNRLKGLSVLIADDDPVVCESTTTLLEEMGIRSKWVITGEDAVQEVVWANKNQDDFFAVILDWKMPGMDGLATVREIRQRLGINVPIIIISAYDFSQIEDEFRQAGADAFIVKPLFKSRIIHTLQTFCRDAAYDPAERAVQKKHDSLKGKRILLVEDNELNRELTIELLEMHHMIVEAVEDGQRAVEKFQTSDNGYYDCILMDIQMPIMNGYEATEAIRSLNRSDSHTVPIIALTANVFAADFAKSRNAGMDAHIAKPIELDRLVDTLTRWID